MSSPSLDIHRIATLSRLKLTDAEATEYEGQLGRILGYMDTLSRFDLDGVEPTAHAMPIFDVWRADEPAASFTSEEALLNAPKKTQDQFVIGKVVE
jgi:aspartyl-tRNA(Asn)/glutamyl-tRNA(Gln) amidotransferase subunit C